ncbi:CLUMA_CG002702, isoform A [Clunio marinus]|uniref:CLUMA_CG002702, isoform A n=1 Tax=Clunio marinus TaxID=568069 RepID=A0A1J1HLT2_9DIPT|nr:CLUMA_CG002702, isoform A [Clunio marinus]
MKIKLEIENRLDLDEYELLLNEKNQPENKIKRMKTHKAELWLKKCCLPFIFMMKYIESKKQLHGYILRKAFKSELICKDNTAENVS